MRVLGGFDSHSPPLFISRHYFRPSDPDTLFLSGMPSLLSEYIMTEKNLPEKKFAITEEAIEELIPDMGWCFATDRIMVSHEEIGFMYREEPEGKGDSGWGFFAGDESQQYLDNPGNSGIYEVNTVANYDPDVIPYLDASWPCAFEKSESATGYRYRLVEEE